MATAINTQIIDVVTELVNLEPRGIHYAELAAKVRARFEGTEIEFKIRPGAGRLHRAISNYARLPGASVYRPSRGVYRHTRFREEA